MTIFLDDVDYRRFVYLLGDVFEDLKIDCCNYCVMPNHYHAAIRPAHENLSEAFQRLNSRYASWWNWRHKRVGHVFQGRFKDQIVQEDGYLLTLCRYIALNPVRAELVEQPEQWQWSSYAATVGLTHPPSFLSIDPVLAQYGEGERCVLQSRYKEHVLASDDDARPLEDRIRSNERILGDRAFKKSIQKKLVVDD